MRLINFLLYFFYKIFRFNKVRNYLVFPNKTFIRVYFKNIPTSIIYNNEYYYVDSNVYEIVSDILINNWINLKKMDSA